MVPEHRPCHDEDCDLCLQFLARQQSINDKLAKLASEAARDTDFRHLIAEKEQQCADLEKATVKVMEVMSKRIEELTKALEKKHVELHSKNRKRVDVTKMPLAEHDAYEVKLAQSFQILHEILPTVEPVKWVEAQLGYLFQFPVLTSDTCYTMKQSHHQRLQFRWKLPWRLWLRIELRSWPRQQSPRLRHRMQQS